MTQKRANHISPGRNRQNRINRQLLASELQAKRAERSSEEQLKVLDQRLGNSQGAKRERSRLQTQLVNAKKKSGKAEGDNTKSHKKNRKSKKS